MEANMNIYPLFSSVVSASIIKEDFTETFSLLKQEHFSTTDSFNNLNSFASIDNKVLKKHATLEDRILKEFYKFKNEYLRYEDTDFVITTSWVTKTMPKGYSQLHNHKNSYYSGVLYFEECIDGNILFETNANNQSIKLNDPNEWNIYNFETFNIAPQKNLVIFFPSYLKHMVLPFNGDVPRYSLAFNLFPVGDIGVGDSSINLSVYK